MKNKSYKKLAECDEKCEECKIKDKINPDYYMHCRVKHKIDKYEELSKRKKYQYYTISALSIILAASVPVLIQIECIEEIIPTILGLILTILVGLEKLFMFREHWKIMTWGRRKH